MSASSPPSSTATVDRGAVPVAATAEDGTRTGTTVTTAVATAATTRVEVRDMHAPRGAWRPRGCQRVERVPTVNPPGRTLRADTTDPPRHQGQNASNVPNHAQPKSSSPWSRTRGEP